MRLLRSAMTQGQRRVYDRIICDRLYDLLNRKKHVALYMPLPQEVDILPLAEKLLSSGVAVYSPKWTGEGYVLSRIRSFNAEDLSYGPMKVPESKYTDIVAFNEVDAYVVPGLAFSSSGRRIGYGGGWYDRMLQNSSECVVKIGVCYSFQILPSLPCENHDVKMDVVVCEA